MRRTFNAFADWMGDTDVDAWSTTVRIVLAILFVFVAATVVVLVLSAIIVWTQAFNPPPAHGSCKSGHYVSVKGRHFVCDEFYPLPQVEGQ